MGDSRVVRVRFQRPDEAATQAERQAARLKAPRVYVADAAALDEIRVSLENLPRTLTDASTLNEVDPLIRAQFGLKSEEALKAVRAQAEDGKSSATWLTQVDRLSNLLRHTPMVDEQTYQRQSQAVADRIELRVGDQPPAWARTDDLINVDSPGLDARLRAMVASAGFTGVLAETAQARIKHRLHATFKLDLAASDELAQSAATAVAPAEHHVPAGPGDRHRGRETHA